MKKKSLFKDSFFATGFVLVTIYLLSLIPMQSDLVNPISKALADFNLTDINFAVLRQRPTVDSNIVLVNIGPAVRDRNGLADLINELNRNNPKVIGIDAFFRKPKEDPYIDSALVRAFSRTKNLVIVSELEENEDGSVINDSITTSHSMFMKYAQHGFADMISKGKEHFKISRECPVLENVKRFRKWKDTTVIVERREIKKVTKIKKDTFVIKEQMDFDEVIKVKKDTTIEVLVYEYGDTIREKRDTLIWSQIVKDTGFYSFPVKMASIFAPEKVNKLLQRNKEVEIISFQGNIDPREKDVSENAKIAFSAIDWTQVMNREYVPELIKDKIVIIGYLGDTIGTYSWEDKFFTPLNANYIGKANPDMFGVVVHANIVSMILKEDYIDEMPEWLNLVLAVIVIFFNVWFFSWLYFRTEIWYDGLSNLITLLLIMVLIIVAITVFHFYNYIIDITLPSVALFLTGNLVEFHYGIVKQSVMKFGSKVPYLNKIIPIFTKK